MTKFNDEYVHALQCIGNTRLPYVIFVDKTIDIGRHDVFKYLSCAKQLLHITDKTFDEVVEAIDKTVLVVELIGDVEQLSGAIGLLVTEAIVAECGKVSKPFRLHKTLDCSNAVVNVYLKQLIDTPNIVAFSAKSNAALCHDLFNVDIQPWHTMLVNKATNEAVLIIWDIREIIAYAKVDNRINDILAMKHANDNSLMLYDTHSKVPAMSGFSDYIVTL